MSKNILIIGGGITALSVLHYLKKKYAERRDIDFLLFEKNDYAGGSICTFDCGGCLVEGGPNGFRDSKISTLQLARELGLEGELIRASPQAKIRYLAVADKLYPLPTNPKNFLTFPLLSVANKLRAAAEPFVAKGQNPDESVYDFAKRRLGHKIAETFIDPMVTGIYAGDPKALNLRVAFPRLYEWEQVYGSLFKAIVAQIKEKAKPMGGDLWSFKSGMQALTNRLFEKYQEHIHLSEDVQTISRTPNGFKVTTKKTSCEANEVFLCTPAYTASSLTQNLNPFLSQYLRQINYAPISVVGLIYRHADVKTCPPGFGYLIASSQNKKVLGALFTNQIFPEHGKNDAWGVRVMIGGIRFPDILSHTDEELIALAKDELRATLQITAQPIAAHIRNWPRAIPQYDNTLAALREKIKKEAQKIPHFYLASNYLEGVSVNDCTQEGKRAAQKSSLEAIAG